MIELLAFEKKTQPVIVRIDEMSPLYDLAPRDILSKQFEIIVTLDGTTQETGNQIQVRTKKSKDLCTHAVWKLQDKVRACSSRGAWPDSLSQPQR